MDKLSVIIAAREDVKAFYDLMESIEEMTYNPANLEILVAIDDNDKILTDLKQHLTNKYVPFSMQIFIRSQSEHFSKDYFSWLASKAQGRFILPITFGCKIMTKDWDKIILDKMIQKSEEYGDDLLHGLVKDNITRTGEDPLYPHFSCTPLVSKKHVEVLGYFFDERNWCWGADQCVALLYKELSKLLSQQRLVSLVEVSIFSFGDIHTTTLEDLKDIAWKIGRQPTNENIDIILNVLRIKNKGYQKFLRISQEHPFTMSEKDAIIEASKLVKYLKEKNA